MTLIDGNSDRSIFDLQDFNRTEITGLKDFFNGLVFSEPCIIKKLNILYKDSFIPGVSKEIGVLRDISFNIIDRFLEKSESIKDPADRLITFRKLIWIFTALLLSSGRIILLDDPDIKLRKEQSVLLGKWIVEYSRIYGNQIIIATHNASFLTGILEKLEDIDVFQLERTDNNTFFKPIKLEAQQMLLNQYSFLLRGF
ncbi:MAG: hypothetical protein MUP02_09795 [Actinobacteria bacterium]|nr:hypothetical protein [Actinomycetota bacterium]